MSPTDTLWSCNNIYGCLSIGPPPTPQGIVHSLFSKPTCVEGVWKNPAGPRRESVAGSGWQWLAVAKPTRELGHLIVSEAAETA